MKNIKRIEDCINFKVGNLLKLEHTIAMQKEQKHESLTTPLGWGFGKMVYFKKGDLLLCIWINPLKENGNDTIWVQIGFLDKRGDIVFRQSLNKVFNTLMRKCIP